MRLRLRRSDEEQPLEEAPAESEAPAEPVREERREWQALLWLKLIALLAVAAYAVAFVLENRKRVKLHFVFGDAHLSLIWLVLLSIALGLLCGVLFSQLNRRRRRRK